MLIAVIAVCLIAAGVAILVMWQLGGRIADATAAPGASGKQLTAEQQIECSSIRREHESWNRLTGKLPTMTPTGADNRFWLDELRTEGRLYLKTVSDYPDQPSKDLAVAVAQYNVDLGFVSLEQQLNGKFSKEKHDKAIQSAYAVLTAYDRFINQTC